MSLFYKFSAYIKDNTESLAFEVVETVIGKIETDISEQEREQAIAMYIGLFGFFAESLIQEDKNTVPAPLISWSKKNAEMQVASGGNISSIVVRYPPTRDIFNEILTRISIELGLTVKENAFTIKLINNMLDISLNETIFAFEHLSTKSKQEIKKELVKLSAPIVPVKDNIAILPLIGYFDEDRTKYLTDHVVPRIAEMGIYHVIADFSGVLTIDALIADSFHQIGGTLRLMGIHVVAAGLRPELVRTIVHGSIDMAGIESFASVKQALESIE